MSAPPALNVPAPAPWRVGLVLGAVLLGAVAVFSLGVMYGSQLAELQAGSPPASVAAAPAALPSPPAAPVPSASIPADRLTFYDRLSGAAPSPPPPLPEGQAPAASAASATGATAAALTPVPEPPPARSGPEPKAEVAATPKAPAAAKPAKPPAHSPAGDPAARIRKLAGKGTFSVQVAAVADRTAASETAARLKGHGLDVVMVLAVTKGKTWYRVRVGSFPSQKAATQAAGIFRAEFGLNAIPVRD